MPHGIMGPSSQRGAVLTFAFKGQNDEKTVFSCGLAFYNLRHT